MEVNANELFVSGIDLVLGNRQDAHGDGLS